MNSRRLPHLLTATVLAASLMLVACGGGSGEAPPSAPGAAVDSTGLVVTITDSVAETTATGPVTFTFAFNKDVGTSFTVDDITVTGGAKGTFTRVSGTSATLVVTPTANSTGMIVLSVAANGAQDAVGKGSAAASSQQAFDTVVLTQMALPVSFDSASVNYGLTGFGGAEDSTIVVDPTLATNKVAKVVRAAGAETYAGTTVTAVNGAGVQTGLLPKIPFNVTDTRMTVRVWSPEAGIPVRLKVEDSADPNKSVETETTTTAAGAWQTLTFNFATQAAGTAALNVAYNYNKPTIFFDFGRAKAAAVLKTYYFDDLGFLPGAAGGGGGGGGACGTMTPTCAPTTTTPAGATVIYTDAASIAGLLKNPDWGQSPAVVFTEPTIAGNKSLSYTFGGTALYEGIDWAGTPQDVSTKGNLHLDFFSGNITSVKVSIISAGKENFVTKTVTPGSWNLIDIDMALYTVPVKSAIIQIKLEPNVAGTLYVDNIYFSGTAAAGGGAGSCTAGVLMGAGGPQTLALSTGDSKGIFAAGEGLFAFDYKGSIDSLGNFAAWAGGRTDGTPTCGDIGYFNDTAMSNSAQKLDEGGWIVGTSLDPGGTPNFFRYFVLLKPEATFASSYIGLFANAPNNGTLNVSTFGSIKFRLWGPAEMYQQGNLNPVLEMVLSGPKVAGCVATGSGGTEISKNVTANLKIGAGSAYKVGLVGFTVKGVCGTDTAGTAVAAVLANLARVAFTVPASSFNFLNANPGATPSYSSGINLGPIGFTNF